MSGNGPRKLDNESRLSDSRLAGDDRDLLLSASGALPARAKPRDLLFAPDEMHGFAGAVSH
jgi:hypothetical protein